MCSDVTNFRLAITDKISYCQRYNKDYLGAFLYSNAATIVKMMLGSHAARKGGKFPFVENTVENLSITTNRAAVTIPNAMCRPLPPLVFLAATATPMMVRIITEIGVAIRL